MISKKIVLLLITMILCLSLMSLTIVTTATEPPKDYSDPKNLLPGSYIGLDDYGFPYAKDLGVLRGSFYEMGVQFGERDAVRILEMVDHHVLPVIVKQFESVEQCLVTLAKYRKCHEIFSPQWMDFVAGSAVGAAEELKKSKYAKDFSLFDIMFALNLEWAIRNPPRWRMEELGIGTLSSNRSNEAEELMHACNGMWVKGSATKYGQTFTYFSNQMILYPHYKCVMIPDDPKANVVFLTGSVGRVFQNGYMISDKGVEFHVLAAGVSTGTPEGDKFKDFGLETYVPLAHAAWFAKDAKEAVEWLTQGTPEYREKTGRKSLLRARPNIVSITDQNEAYVVEFTAHRYGIRRPGDLGEKENNYIAFSNNFFSDHSYDENNVKTSLPMTEYANSSPTNRTSSAERSYTFMWLVKNNYGKIDKDMLMYEIAPTHCRYKEDGTKIEPELNEDGYFVPINAVCSHRGYKVGELPSGSMRSVLHLHDTLDIWHIPAWPCLFKNKAWNHTNIYWRRPYLQ